jgi:hypothetical protein
VDIVGIQRHGCGFGAALEQLIGVYEFIVG